MNPDPDTPDTADEAFSDDELAAIECHKYYLSEAAGCDVGEEYARENWRYHHSHRWRQQRLREDIAQQITEMRKHRWIESEKAGTDLGSQVEIEWIRKFAAQWRQWREQQRARRADSDQDPDTPPGVDSNS